MFLNPYKSNELAEGHDSDSIEIFWFRLFCAFVIETEVLFLSIQLAYYSDLYDFPT